MRSRACGGPVRKAGRVAAGFGSVFGSVPANAARFREVLISVSAWANALWGTARYGAQNTRNEQVVGSIPTGGSRKSQFTTMISDQVRCL